MSGAGGRAGEITLPLTAAGVRVVLRQVLAAFEPEAISATEAADLVGVFGEIERLAAAGRLLAAERMAKTTAWAGDGDTDVASWMARTTGQSRADAKRDLAAARALGELDDTRDALRQGRLTKEQVRELAPAAAVAPGQEADLLQEAETGSVERLTHKARAAKAAARRDGRDAVERMRRRRSVTHGQADDGSAWVRASGPPDDVARIIAGLSPWEHAARAEARERGEALTDEQARFDGLVALAAEPRPIDDEADDRAVDSERDRVADDGLGDLDDEASRPNDDDTGEVAGKGSNVPTGAGSDDTPPGDTTGRRGGVDAMPGDGTDGVDGRRGGRWTSRATPTHGHPTAADDRRPPPGARRQRGGTPRWAAKVIVNIDLQALRRGHALPGERCSITGIGPVPVAVVEDLLDREDTFLAAVVRDGEDIQRVAHLGRAPTARQRTALEARHDRCCIDGCPDPPEVIDHHHRFADDGPRTIANLGPLCATHDHRKTHEGWVLVRDGRSRRLVPPDHPLAGGAVPGGCVDLDDPAGLDAAVEAPGSAEQLDLLAG